MKLEPNLHSLVWGTERWEVSARPDSPSVISDGGMRGRSLADAKKGFPLLVKVIDAKTRLSVQVHPNERTAQLTGGEPKTEMWCILRAGPIYAGLKPGTTAADVEASVKSGRFEEILVRHDAKPFETYFIPGGLVHSIGDGVKLYEVQQSSDTTYRLYDWGRLGTDGRPRELHVAKSLQSIDFSLPVPLPQKGVRCPFFDFSQHDFAEPAEVSAPSDSFLVVYEVEKDSSLLLDAGEKATVGPGRVFLTSLPSAAAEKANSPLTGRRVV